MLNEIPPEVLKAFTTYQPDLPDPIAGDLKIEKLGGGLINTSFKICSQLQPTFFLQKINKLVFTNPDFVQKNYMHIWEYAESNITKVRLPAPKEWDRNKTLFIDKIGDFWRAFEYIENTKMYSIAETPDQAKTTAKTFASFTKSFIDFKVGLLNEVIPNFHNLSFRYYQFEEALRNSTLSDRMVNALSIIQELKSRERYKLFYESLTKSDQFRKRVMHHDAKIANVLFDKKTNEVVCPVDFDTVMPGYFFSDIGDMIRTMTGNKDENSTDFAHIEIRKDFYEAIVTGYLEEFGNKLSNAEKKHIHYAGLLMIYMQALRFITDFLNGDIYYQIEYAEQNFDRAKNQLKLLNRLEEFLKNQNKLIDY